MRISIITYDKKTIERIKKRILLQIPDCGYELLNRNKLELRDLSINFDDRMIIINDYSKVPAIKDKDLLIQKYFNKILKNEEVMIATDRKTEYSKAYGASKKLTVTYE